MSTAAFSGVKTTGVHLEQIVSFGGSTIGRYALGRAEGSPELGERRVLVPVSTADEQRSGAPTPAAPIVVPADMSSEVAVLIPLVAESLRVWDALDAEIAAAAIVTRAAPWSDLLVEVGGWYGTRPLEVGFGKRADGAAAVDITDPDAVKAVRKALEAYPLVCAVELTGRAAAAEFFFESLPSQARVMFAGPPEERLTIDYYVNVHRKGLHLRSTVLAPLRTFDSHGVAERVRRATRLLRNPARSQAALAAATGAMVVTFN